MTTREIVVTQMRSFLGAKTGDALHKYIVDTYNGYVRTGKSKGSTYKVTYSDAWCATAVSTCAILANATDIIPTECSCSRMIKLMKQMGIYNGNDNFEGARSGDVLFYNWNAKTEAEDNGADGVAHHVGIIESYDSKNKIYTVIEGNMGGECKRRRIKVGWIYIQGFGLPKYAEDVPQYHIVKTGEYMSKIAVMYNTTIDELKRLNPSIKNINLIYPGQRVRVK